MFYKTERNISNLIKVTTLIVINIYNLCVSGYYEKREGIYYINLWTNPNHTPFKYIKQGHDTFADQNCLFQNCYITITLQYLKHETSYDAILFNAITLWKTPFLKLPNKRFEYQKYILVSSKPSTAYPVTGRYNNFFNWTWTYKLDSDISLAYIAIKDIFGNVIGPKNEMVWIDKDNMKRTSHKIIEKFDHKSKAAAWIISSCDTLTQYDTFMKKLKKELHKYSHVVDIFGPCGNKMCPHNKLPDCFTLLEKEYYFYLAFEDSMAEDYVTNELLRALYHYTVPVVFGGANYTRFLPDGMYLDALELGPTKLAKEMHRIIRSPISYYDMFRWRRYYSYYNPLRSPETNGMCQLCAILNNDYKREEIKTYKSIVKWFNDRKDWDIWNTRRNIPNSIFTRSIEATQDNHSNKLISSNYYMSDKNMKDNNLSDNYIRDNDLSDDKKRGSHSIVYMDDDDNDYSESDIIAMDEKSLRIHDVVKEVYNVPDSK